MCMARVPGRMTGRHVLVVIIAYEYQVLFLTPSPVGGAGWCGVVWWWFSHNLPTTFTIHPPTLLIDYLLCILNHTTFLFRGTLADLVCVRVYDERLFCPPPPLPPPRKKRFKITENCSGGYHCCEKFMQMLCALLLIRTAPPRDDLQPDLTD